MSSGNNYKYTRDDGTVLYGLSYEDAIKEEEKEKKEKKAADVMNQFDQMAKSGNYTLEGAMAIAAKNRVGDDPNVQAYIKSLADDMVNKNASKQFGFDQQTSGNMPAQSQSQQTPSSGNTLSSWSSGTPFFNDVDGQDNQNIVDSLQFDKNAKPWSSQNNQSVPQGSGNTVLSALQGGQQQPASQQGGEHQSDFITRLPGELQSYIKRTGLSVADYETPVREFLVKRDATAFYKSMASLVDAKRKADEALANNDRERSFGIVKDLYGKAPMSGPDGGSSFTADDVTRGKVSFGTDRLPTPVSRSEHKSYSYTSGSGNGQTNENLVKLQEARTNLIKVLNESGLDDVTRSNMLNGIDSQIEQEAKKSGYMTPAKISDKAIKQLNDAKMWLDEQEKLKDNKRDASYGQVLRAYEAMKQQYGIRF